MLKNFTKNFWFVLNCFLLVFYCNLNSIYVVTQKVAFPLSISLSLAVFFVVLFFYIRLEGQRLLCIQFHCVFLCIIFFVSTDWENMLGHRFFVRFVIVIVLVGLRLHECFCCCEPQTHFILFTVCAKYVILVSVPSIRIIILFILSILMLFALSLSCHFIWPMSSTGLRSYSVSQNKKQFCLNGTKPNRPETIALDADIHLIIN